MTAENRTKPLHTNVAAISTWFPSWRTPTERVQQEEARREPADKRERANYDEYARPERTLELATSRVREESINISAPKTTTWRLGIYEHPKRPPPFLLAARTSVPRPSSSRVAWLHLEPADTATGLGARRNGTEHGRREGTQLRKKNCKTIISQKLYRCGHKVMTLSKRDSERSHLRTPSTTDHADPRIFNIGYKGFPQPLRYRRGLLRIILSKSSPDALFFAQAV